MSHNISGVIPIAELLQKRRGSSRAESAELFDEARSYISSFTWCRAIRGGYGGIVIPGVVGVFLFHIIPAHSEVDEWIWVIVGDLPPAYITAENNSDPASALSGYIAEMQEWVESAVNGAPVTELIPVNVPPTPENAERLNRRLRLLEELALSTYSIDFDEED